MNNFLWHFVATDRRLGYGDERLVKPGQTYTVDREPVLCEVGLHASKRLLDALKYAPGPILCKVNLGGTVVHDIDKSVGTERTVLSVADVTDILQEFALSLIYSVWIKQYPDPEHIVARYFKTGNESLRDAARVAAEDVARDTAGAAAWTAAVAAARAAGDAAWAARAAARDAAEAAARASARDTAWVASRAAAWAAAWDAQNDLLIKMVNKAKWERL